MNLSTGDPEVAQVLVGFTTEQVTSNLVPIVQTKATHFVAVDSHRAREQRWGEGLEQVLRDRGVRHDRISLDRQDETSVGGLRDAVEKGLKALGLWAEPIGWVFGGGLKIQQFAAFMLFLERTASGMADIGFYADADGRTLVRLRRNADGQLTEERETTAVDLKVSEILQAFNYTVRLSHRMPVESDQVNAEYHRFITDSTYRMVWLQRFERRAMDEETSVDNLLKKIGNDATAKKTFRIRSERSIMQWLDSLSFPEEQRNLSNDTFRKQCVARIVRTCLDSDTWREALYPEKCFEPIATNIGTYNNFSRYFEQLVICRVRDVLASNPSANVVDLESNIEVFSRDGGPVAEHDILIARRNGTLTSLDVKTFGIEKKDLDARLMNLRNASGRFARYVLVFPWFIEDLDGMPQKLKEMPLECAKWGQDFLVVSSQREPFWVRFQPGTRIVEVCEEGAEGAVRCRNLESYLDELVGAVG